MDLSDIDEGDLLSRVLCQSADTAVPAAKPRGAPAAATGAAAFEYQGILGTTRVMTSFGHVPAHLLRVGDTIRTRDGGFERVESIRDLKLDLDFLARHPEAAPVLIRRNGIQSGAPHQDVGLSPAQIVSVGPNRFESKLVRAETLSRERGGIDRSLGMMVYVQIRLTRDAQINCDGLWVAVAGI